jgi:hypothetical protein
MRARTSTGFATAGVVLDCVLPDMGTGLGCQFDWDGTLRKRIGEREPGHVRISPLEPELPP